MHMKINRKLLLLVMAAGLFFLGAGLSRAWLGLPPPKLTANGSQVGQRGPIGLVFSQAMQTSTVEQRWRIQPDVKGKFEWGKNTTLWFFPEQPLQTGETYQISLSQGSVSLDGKVIGQDAGWQVIAREPEIIYQTPSGDKSDLWVRSPKLGQPRQLTVGKKPYDYALSFDGEQIAFSAANVQKGYDLWMMDRDGKNQRIMVECGAGWCINPTWSPDGQNIAYSKMEVAASPQGTPTQIAQSQENTGAGSNSLTDPRIWTVEISTGQTNPLYADLTITGTNPTWSPDGRWLAFIDTNSGGIRIMDLETKQDKAIQANTPVLGAWSMDGSKLFFADLDTSDLPSFGAAYQVEFPGQAVLSLFEKGPDQTDYGLPVESPDGLWMAVGVRFVQGSSSRQLWLLSPDGTKQKIISGDQVITHGAYSWSPDGSALIFQQVALDSSSARPAVMIWDANSDAMTLIAQDATHPQWLP